VGVYKYITMPAFEMFNCVMGKCMLLLDGVMATGLLLTANVTPIKYELMTYYRCTCLFCLSDVSIFFIL